MATPIEGPGKKDHGDVDILVALERRLIFPSTSDNTTQRTPRDLMEAIRRLLGAQYAIVQPTGTSANLAIRWPSDVDHHPVSTNDELPDIEGTTDKYDESKEKFIQVDVRICPDVDQLCWVSTVEDPSWSARLALDCTPKTKTSANGPIEFVQACPWRLMESSWKHHSALWAHCRRGGTLAKNTRD